MSFTFDFPSGVGRVDGRPFTRTGGPPFDNDKHEAFHPEFAAADEGWESNPLHPPETSGPALRNSPEGTTEPLARHGSAGTEEQKASSPGRDGT